MPPGPGHGKVVISSYLVANEQRVRRGVAIAFIAAFVQALVAVGIVGVMAVVLNMTSAWRSLDTAKVFEAGSFALVAALGLYLLVRKGRRGVGGAARRRSRTRIIIITIMATARMPTMARRDACVEPASRLASGAAREGRVWLRRRRGDPLGRHPALHRRAGRARLRAGAGHLLGGRRLDLPDGARHGDHGGRACRARGRRQGHRPALDARRRPARRSGHARARARRGAPDHRARRRALRRDRSTA